MKRFRRTPQRLAILKFLEGNISHPSAEDIRSSLKKPFPTLSPATVYNTLETLREMGRVVEIDIDSGKKRFDPKTESHHHLICIGCKKILDIPEKCRPVLTEHEKRGFRIIRSKVEFYGLCLKCQRRSS
jgi:Fur family peroxide stress response transcriptional regulator